MIIDVDISGERRVYDKKIRNDRKIRLVEKRSCQIMNMKKVVVIPIIDGILGTIISKF